MEQRTCSRCGEAKGAADFPPKRLVCRDCRREDNRQWREANADRVRERARRYREEHSEELKAYFRTRYQERRGEILAEKRAYHVANRERILAYRKTYNDLNREATREYSRRWRRNNRDRHRAAASKWARDNPDAARARRVIRDERIASSPSNITREGLASRIAYYGGLCWICREAPWEHLDHVKPLAAGGPHLLANLRPACAPCNLTKHAQWPFEREVA